MVLFESTVKTFLRLEYHIIESQLEITHKSADSLQVFSWRAREKRRETTSPDDKEAVHLFSSIHLNARRQPPRFEPVKDLN